MTIEEQYVGVTYRQIAGHLKVSRGYGRPKLDSARPRERNKDGNFVYTDSAEAPTLVTFDAECVVDVELLLRSGSIVEYEAPAAVPEETATPAMPKGRRVR